MHKQNSSLSPEDRRVFRRFLQQKDGIETYLLKGETVDDMEQRIQRIVKDSFFDPAQLKSANRTAGILPGWCGDVRPRSPKRG